MILLFKKSETGLIYKIQVSPVSVSESLVCGKQVKELLDVSQPREKNKNSAIHLCKLWRFFWQNADRKILHSTH